MPWRLVSKGSGVVSFAANAKGVNCPRERCTGRQTCHQFGLHHSTFSYQPRESAPRLAKPKAVLRRLSYEFPEWGYAKITRLLKEEGWRVGARRCNSHISSWDFVHDTTMRGGKLRILNVIDEYNCAPPKRIILSSFSMLSIPYL